MNVGDKLPLFYQAASYATGLFVQATVVDASGNPLVGSPFNLSAQNTTGLYGNTTPTMPNSPWVYVNYLAYTDSGHTVLSGSSGATDDIIFLIPNGGNVTIFPNVSNITGVIESGDQCQIFPIQDTITMGSDRTLAVRLEDAAGNPFPLTGWTLIDFRFLNADGTVLSLTTAGPVNVVNAAAGQLTCMLTAAQTLLLSPSIPAPFTVVVTQPSGLTVVNFPTQLAIIQADV
jgi:hypothetical protein